MTKTSKIAVAGVALLLTALAAGTAQARGWGIDPNGSAGYAFMAPNGAVAALLLLDASQGMDPNGRN